MQVFDDRLIHTRTPRQNATQRFGMNLLCDFTVRLQVECYNGATAENQSAFIDRRKVFLFRLRHPMHRLHASLWSLRVEIDQLGTRSGNHCRSIQ